MAHGQRPAAGGLWLDSGPVSGLIIPVVIVVVTLEEQKSSRAAGETSRSEYEMRSGRRGQKSPSSSESEEEANQLCQGLAYGLARSARSILSQFIVPSLTPWHLGRMRELWLLLLLMTLTTIYTNRQ